MVQSFDIFTLEANDKRGKVLGRLTAPSTILNISTSKYISKDVTGPGPDVELHSTQCCRAQAHELKIMLPELVRVVVRHLHGGHSPQSEDERIADAVDARFTRT